MKFFTTQLLIALLSLLVISCQPVPKEDGNTSPGEVSSEISERAKVIYRSLLNPPLPLEVEFKSAQFCQIKNDYNSAISCEGSFKIQSEGDLELYKQAGGLFDGKYKDASIEVSLNQENLELHSPCKIVLKKKMIIQGVSVCLDARSGFKVSKNSSIKASKLSLLTMNGDINLKKDLILEGDTIILFSKNKVTLDNDSSVSGKDNIYIVAGTNGTNDRGTVHLKKDSFLKADRIVILADKSIEFNKDASLTAVHSINAMTLGREPSDLILLKKDSHALAKNLNLTSYGVLQIEKGNIIEITGELYFNAPVCVLKEVTYLNSPTQKGKCFYPGDFTAPIVTTDLEDNIITNVELLNFNVTSSDIIPVTTTVFLNGNLVYDEDTSEANVSITLKDGLNQVEVLVTDFALNESELLIFGSIVLDKTPPEISNVHPLNGEYLKSSELLISGDVNEEIISASANGNELNINVLRFFGSFIPTEGALSLKISSFDRAGNEGSILRNIFIDDTAPVITLNNPDNIVSSNSNYSLSFNIADASPVTTKVFHNNFLIFEGSLNDVSVPVVLSRGINTFKVTGLDAAGNIAIGKSLNNVKLNELPISSFSCSSPGPHLISCNGATSSDSDGRIVDYTWNLSDGSTYKGDIFIAQLRGGGNFGVSLSVTDDLGGVGASNRTVSILHNQAPIASFNCASSFLKVSCDASASNDADGSIASYSWSVDGQNFSGSSLSYNYLSEGAKTVSMTVTDNLGAITSLSKDLTLVANKPPVISFTCNSSSSRSLSCDASASTDSDGIIVSYSWGLSDGSTQTGSSFLTNLASGGIYDVTVVATDDQGTSSTQTKTVTVISNQAPAAVISCQSDFLAISCDSGLSTDNDGTITSYSWSIDGQSFSSASISYLFSTEGAKIISLTVTDNLGATHTSSKNLEINENQKPIAYFTCDVTGLSIRCDASESIDPNGGNLTYVWNITGKENLYSKVVDYSFENSGDYIVSLTVTNSFGKKSSTSHTVSLLDLKVTLERIDFSIGDIIVFRISGSFLAEETMNARIGTENIILGNGGTFEGVKIFAGYIPKIEPGQYGVEILGNIFPVNVLSSTDVGNPRQIVTDYIEKIILGLEDVKIREAGFSLGTTRQLIEEHEQNIREMKDILLQSTDSELQEIANILSKNSSFLKIVESKIPFNRRHERENILDRVRYSPLDLFFNKAEASPILAWGVFVSTILVTNYVLQQQAKECAAEGGGEGASSVEAATSTGLSNLLVSTFVAGSSYTPWGLAIAISSLGMAYMGYSSACNFDNPRLKVKCTEILISEELSRDKWICNFEVECILNGYDGICSPGSTTHPFIYSRKGEKPVDKLTRTSYMRWADSSGMGREVKRECSCF